MPSWVYFKGTNLLMKGERKDGAVFIGRLLLLLQLLLRRRQVGKRHRRQLVGAGADDPAVRVHALRYPRQRVRARP